MTDKKELEIVSNGMFHTYETSEELYEYFEKYTGQEKVMLYMGAILFNNMIANQLNGKYVEK